MINTVYQVVQVIFNKEQSGYLSPTEYNLVLKQVQDEIYRSYFEDINRDQVRENKGLSNPGYGNLTDNQREKLATFMSSADLTISGGSYTLPSDLYYIEEDGVITENNKVVDLVPNYKRGYLSQSLAAPSLVFPVCYRAGNKLYVLPTTYVGALKIYYIRIPNDPVWGYVVGPNGDPLYNASASTDIELHPSEFSNIVIRVLSYFGISVREGEVVQVAEGLKNQTTVNDNN